MLNNTAFLLALAFIGGTLIAGQGAINGRMAAVVGHPIQAAILSFGVGLLGLMLLSQITGVGLPSPARAITAPWWAWIGGLMGAYLVATAAMAVPKIGAASWVTGVIAGQLCAALLYDHIGAFGLEPKPIDLQRMAGAIFLAAGVYLMRR